VVAVRHAGLEAGGVAGAKDGLALVLDEHELAFEHDEELVLVLVPVSLRGRRAGFSRTRLTPNCVPAAPHRLSALEPSGPLTASAIGRG
jgi:hypothetical protein